MHISDKLRLAPVVVLVTSGTSLGFFVCVSFLVLCMFSILSDNWELVLFSRYTFLK